VCVHSSGHIWGVWDEVSGAHFNGWLRNTCIFELKFVINNNCINANTFWVRTTGVYIVVEVPIHMGYLEGGSHEGFPDWWRTHEYGNLICKNLFFFFPPFLLYCVFEFFWSVPSKNLSMGTWERRDIAGSPPLHSSLGIFCWGRSLKIQRDTKREVLTYWGKSSRPQALPSVQICSNSMYQLGMTRTDFVFGRPFCKMKCPLWQAFHFLEHPPNNSWEKLYAW